MDKVQIQTRMREILAEYSELKSQLDELNNGNRSTEFEKKQRARLELFKGKYTVEIIKDGVIRPIDWEDVSRNLFSEQNIAAGGTQGYMLGYDQDGDATFGSTGGVACTYCYDQTDAERLLERANKRAELAAANRRR